MTKQQFIEAIAAAVIKIAPEFGICVYSPVIAQACLESGYGTSELAVNANNFFGIKHRDGRCPSSCGIYNKVGSEQNPDGSYISSAMKWEKFNSLESGVRGYFEFINVSRYQNLKGITDPYKYLETIKADGYATSINYVTNVYNTLKNNNLEKYDKKEEQIQMANFKVHLDPGHYGSCYNKTTVAGLNYYESQMTWKLAGYLKTELEKRGVTVTLSRSNIDQNPELYNRGYGAKGCDLFLSLHSNACGSESVDYPVVYRGFDKTIADEFGKKLADMVHDLMGCKQAGRTATKKGSNGEYYGVLRGARAAGLDYYYIVEHGFHTNAANTKWLSDDNNIKTLAAKEAELICSYFSVKSEVPVTPSTPTPSQPASSELYRVRLSWTDAKSQIGAYSIFENAKKACKEGYTVYNIKGEAVYSNVKAEEPAQTFESYTVKITADVLNVRTGSGTNYPVKTTVKKNEVYTIVDEKNGWGKLKSGAGWISLAYTTKNGSTAAQTVTTRTYVVKKGDSYWKIAAEQLGKGSRYTEIQKLNNSKALYAGMKILIPLK